MSFIVSAFKKNYVSFQGCRKRTLSVSEKIWNSFLCLQSSEYLLQLRNGSRGLVIGIHVT